MFEFIQVYRGAAEFLYFLAGIIMPIAIVVAIVQLQLYRKELRVRYQRDATLLTLQICENKLARVSQLWLSLVDVAVDSKMPAEPSGLTGTDRSCLKKGDKWLQALLSDEMADVFNAATDTLNELEAFCQYMLFGLADEELGFRAEGLYFLELLGKLRPYLCALREDGESTTYTSIIEVERMWAGRAERSNLLKQHKKLSEQIEKVGQAAAKPFIGQEL